MLIVHGVQQSFEFLDNSRITICQSTKHNVVLHVSVLVLPSLQSFRQSWAWRFSFDSPIYSTQYAQLRQDVTFDTAKEIIGVCCVT